MAPDVSNEGDPLTDHSTEIQQLRSRISETLEKFPSYNTDFSLLRWLRSESYNVDVVAPKLESALHTLHAVGALNNNLHTLESAQNAFHSITPAAEYFPGGIMGTDRDGNIICVQPMGRARPRKLMPTARVSELYRGLIVECEANMALIRNEEAKRGHEVGVIIISDIAEFNASILYMPAIRVYMNTLSLLQKTMERVEFLGDDWKNTLRERIGEENLLPHWGGTKQANIPTGSIRMGGEIPDELRDKMISSIKRLPDDQLTSISVSAGQAVSIALKVDAPRSVLSWYFTLASGDIDFWISYGTIEAWPRFRITTEFVAEYGEIVCTEVGTYTVHFDNKHGRFWSKDIAYLLLIDGKEVHSSPNQAESGSWNAWDGL